MSGKMRLVSSVVAMTVILLVVGNGMALAVFTVGGVKMICRTCTCAAMADAGVPLGHCVDTMRKTGKPKPFDKLIRYSETDVRLQAPEGKEFPLSSDEAQKQFDQISTKPNKESVSRLRPTAGVISQQRCASLAKDLGIEFVDKSKDVKTR